VDVRRGRHRITCTGLQDLAYTNEPIGLQCNGQDVYPVPGDLTQRVLTETGSALKLRVPGEGVTFRTPAP
jgi:hypothetical protein